MKRHSWLTIAFKIYVYYVYYMYYVLNREKESKMSAEHIFFLFFKCKALNKILLSLESESKI